MPVNFRVIDTKKYMWDGKEYANEGEALNAAADYKKDKFDVQLAKEEGKHFIYTRRDASVET
jgi:hypothetical protein